MVADTIDQLTPLPTTGTPLALASLLEDLMDDLLTQHEDPTGDAGRSAASYLTAALTAAHTAVQWRTRRLAPPDQDQTATVDADRAAYAAVLGPDQGRSADSDTALRAWTIAQPLRTDNRQADQVAQRAEARLRTLHPDAMTRYAALRQHLDPVQAIREVTPLIRQQLGSGAGQPAEHQPLQPERLSPADQAATLTETTAALGAASRDIEDRHDLGHLPTRAHPMPEPEGVQRRRLVEPLVGAAAATAPADGVATTGPGEQLPPQVRLQPVVRDVLHTELATAVLRDHAWPALAVALEQAQQVGAQPAQLLREVAEQRELRTAKHPAQVLTHRLQQRTPTTADLVASCYPTALADTPAVRRPNRGGTDLAPLGAALELTRQGDHERNAGGAEVSTSDDPAAPRVDEHDDGLVAGQAHQRHATAASSRATQLLGHPDSAASEPAPAGPAPSTAARSYPVDLKQVPTDRVQHPTSRPAQVANATAARAAAPSRRR